MDVGQEVMGLWSNGVLESAGAQVWGNQRSSSRAALTKAKYDYVPPLRHSTGPQLHSLWLGLDLEVMLQLRFKAAK